MGLLDTTDTEPKLDDVKDPWNEECAWRQDGFVLHAKISYDDDANQRGPDYLGKVESVEADGSHAIRTRDGPAYFTPEPARYADCEPADAAKYTAEDVEVVRAFYLDEWSYMEIRVTAYRDRVELARAYCGGIESTSGEYFLEAITDLAHEVIPEAKAQAVKITVGDDPWHNDTVQFARVMSELNGGGYGLDYAALGKRVGLTELEVSQLFGRADDVWDAAEKKMCEAIVARCGVAA